MTEISITLDGEPVGKGRPRYNSKTGTVYTPYKTVSYERHLRWAAKAAMKGPGPLAGPLCVTVGAFFTIPKTWTKAEKAAAIDRAHTSKPDLDNIIKMLDALNGIVWKDDSQIAQLTALKRYSSKPALVITVRSL